MSRTRDILVPLLLGGLCWLAGVMLAGIVILLVVIGEAIDLGQANLLQGVVGTAALLPILLFGRRRGWPRRSFLATIAGAVLAAALLVPNWVMPHIHG